MKNSFDTMMIVQKCIQRTDTIEFQDNCEHCFTLLYNARLLSVLWCVFIGNCKHRNEMMVLNIKYKKSDNRYCRKIHIPVVGSPCCARYECERTCIEVFLSTYESNTRMTH